ncbi:MAG: hypothetical protein Q7T16_04170 [Candidatus Burarchaeum sp.]|nr:hypothetical protein [Candidatus Burarchaeum sp.]MDO8339826.1 hypothetical protein [Candidatus Burarchaeum sp.]
MKVMLALLVSVFGLFLLGCAQLQQTQYVCADGKTVVANLAQCSTAPAAGALAAPAAPGVAAPSAAPLTLDAELEVCSGMPEVQQMSLEEFCIMGLAAKHENVSLCKKLSYEGKRQCYLVLATALNDADVCAEAGSEKNSCYNQYASIVQDAAVCEKITDINSKDNCYSQMSSTIGDASLCDKIKTAGMKNGCYFNMAMRLQDTSYCDKITESGQRQNCLQNIGGGGMQELPAKPAQG